MADQLEYVVRNALMVCDKGAAPAFFLPTHNTHIKIQGCLVANKLDKQPLVNIPTFGICSLTQKPCVPGCTEWQKTYKLRVKGQETLLFRSDMPCSLGGKIQFVTSGQVPLPDDAMEDIKSLQEQGSKTDEDEGWGWLDTVELIPVVGSVVGAVREGMKGNWGMMAMNIGFLALDIAGLVSFGTTTAASSAGKAAVKAGVKVAAKSAAKTVAKQVGKSGLKTAVKLTAKGARKAFCKSIDKIVGKASVGHVCVFACFPAGTKINTAFGLKNIEDIKTGDRVWSYDELTGETGLQEIVQTMVRESDHTVELYTKEEIIETTAEHPFLTENGWKDAADLQTGDRIKSRNEEDIEIKDVKFSYKPRKVYNFEVSNWHTYFVGALQWLVHNACLKELARKGIEYAQRILRGIKFNKVMAEKLGKKEFSHEVWLKGMKRRVDTVAKNGKKVISRKATQLHKVTKETAEKYIDEVAGYKGQGVQNPGRMDKGISKIGDDAKTILSVPKQEKPIPKNIKQYAKKKGVDIKEERDITMDNLKNW